MELKDIIQQEEPLSEDYVFRVFMTLVNALQEQQQIINELKKQNADLQILQAAFEKK